MYRKRERRILCMCMSTYAQHTNTHKRFQIHPTIRCGHNSSTTPVIRHVCCLPIPVSFSYVSSALLNTNDTRIARPLCDGPCPSPANASWSPLVHHRLQ